MPWLQKLIFHAFLQDLLFCQTPAQLTSYLNLSAILYRGGGYLSRDFTGGCRPRCARFIYDARPLQTSSVIVPREMGGLAKVVFDIPTPSYTSVTEKLR